MANIVSTPIPKAILKILNTPKMLKTYVAASPGGGGDTRPASGQMQPRGMG